MAQFSSALHKERCYIVSNGFRVTSRMKAPRTPSIAASALGRSVGHRLLLALGLLALLWLAIAWAVAIP
jgi:hypothetical protein